MKTVPGRLETLDGLRGLAAIAILFWHYQHFLMPGPGLPADPATLAGQPFFAVAAPLYRWGWMGVEIFWVISGTVFAHVYLDRERPSLADFARRRLARLYPMHFATLILVAGLQAASILLAGHSQIYANNDLRHFLLHLALASNWGMEAGYSFNAPIWSVSVEVLVYALFFAAMPLLARHRGVALIVVGGTILLQMGDLDWPPLACAAYFFSGTLLHALARAAAARGRHVLLFGAGAGGLVATAMAFGGPLGTPPATILIALGVVGCVVGLDFALGLSHPWLRRLGDLSFPVYLLHVPVQIALLLAFDTGWLDRGLVAEPLFFLAFLLGLPVLALLVHAGFERPVQMRILALGQPRLWPAA